MMITTIIIVFVLGYFLIATEQRTGISKTAVALILGVTLWVLYIFAGSDIISEAHPADFRDFISENPALTHLSLAEQSIRYIIDREIIIHLGDIAEILFYLLGAMTIVGLIDVYGGFTGIISRIRTTNKRKLLWLTGFITFFMSSVLDNMTSAIVMVMVMQKLLSDRQERWIFGSLIIIAANAGGAWTPIGDVTTIMLWINNNITSVEIMKSLFLPSVVSMAIPAAILSFSLKGNLPEITPTNVDLSQSSVLTPRIRNTILIAGILCLLAVPVFKSLTHLPPFMGIMLTLGIIWIYTEIMYKHRGDPPAVQQYQLPYTLSKVDFPTLLFFFGILLAVAALEAVGILDKFSELLNAKIHNVYMISMIIGFLSAVIDNVPLVAAAMGMYPLLTPEAASLMPQAAYMSDFVTNGTFWELIAYCAGTGGSILIIGSAAGVVVMGLEKISFIWYMKHISWLAIVGFLAGTGIYYLQHIL